MSRNKYPYEQMDLDDLPYERWEDIPFLDGLYRVSNLGRIKRLDIEVVTKKGYTMRFKPMIIKQDLYAAKNNGMNDYVYFLRATVCSEGRIYKFGVARVVYYCFVKKFALDDYSLVVLTKDADNKNLKASNLKLTNISQKQKRISERGRLIRDIETTYDEYINEGKIKSKNPYSKQVSQYTLKGKIMKTFPSIRVAEKVTGVREAGIVSVLKKRQVCSGGYVWGYGKKKSIDVAAIRKANLEHRNILRGRKVTQYNLKGQCIAYFNTISEASRTTGVNKSDIIAVLKGTQRSAGGFIWREGFEETKINVQGFLTGEAWRAFRLQKGVMQYSNNGKYIRTYESVKAAALEMGITDSYISTAIKKGWVVKDCLWKFSKLISASGRKSKLKK